MAFDSKKFLKTKFAPRTAEVSVKDLAPFFPEGAKAIWKVRGLTGHELGRANEAADRSRNVLGILEGIISQSSKEQTEAVKNLLGVGGTTPPDIAKRIELLLLGSVEPVCTQDLAVRLCETYPIEFFQITNMILKLTGQGSMPGKPMPSGAIPKSENASPSDTPGGGSSTKCDPTSSRPDT
jgi:hypothetical protein